LWRAITACALCVLTSAAFSCGDDEDGGSVTGGSGGSGGSAGTAGKSGSGGKGGTGGTGGKAATPTPAECKTQTNAIFKGMPDGLSTDCVSCLCDEDAAAIATCNADAVNCWGLINCVAEFKCEGANQVTCATQNCSKFIGGASPAMAAGKPLQGKCSAKCLTADMSDAGMTDKDAGN
jgi:hypothetical protein